MKRLMLAVGLVAFAAGPAAGGLGTLTITAGMSSWKPDGQSESFTSMGGNAAFRVIGGSLLPVAINLQLGVARIGEANTEPSLTRFLVGGGVSASLPTPGISIEPYVS